VTSRTISIILRAAALAMLLGAIPAHAERAAVDATTAASGTDAVTSASKSEARASQGHIAFDLTGFLMGPAFVLACALFVCGCAWRVAQFARLTRSVRPAPPSWPPAQRASAVPRTADREFLLRGRSGLSRLLWRYRRWMGGTVLGTHPVMARVSLLFHVLLFLVPLLLPAHNSLVFKALGVSLPSLPAPFLDLMTLLFLATGGFFLLRRIFVPKVRMLSTLSDYLILLLVAAPFITAYAAHHRWFDYHALMVTHTIVAEALIASIPFTKLGHMPFLIFSRLFTASEYSLKTAGRTW